MLALSTYGRGALRAAWRTTIDGLRRHSVFAALVGFMAAYTAKSMWYGDYFNPHRHPGIHDLPFLDFLASDLLFYGAVMAAAILLENLHWALAFLTIPVTLVVAFVSLANGFWLANTGLQLTYSVFRAALRHADAVPIIVRSVQVWGVVLLFGSLAVSVAVPFLFRARWHRDAPHPRADRWYGLGLAVVLLLLASVGLALQDKPKMSGWRLNAGNVFMGLVRDMRDPLQREPTRALPRSPPGVLSKEQPALVNPPNLILFMLEAVSHRESSFGAPRANRTPFLAALARRGLYVPRMRAVLPHTTKSLYSFVCGRYPAMQNATIETADNFGMRCLPHLLKEHGYATALMQSADGSFEDRPRLAANMGFEEFWAWPELPTPRLGYLASDDRALLPPAIRWIETRRRPFMLLLVTSITHHTYRPPAAHPEALNLRNQERYRWLMRYLDQILADLVQWLDRTGRLRNTIVFAFGDHGEGFGEHGLYQHDNTYYEEGLRVPFVVFAPARIGGPRVVPENRSLNDLPPTVLDLVGLRYRPDAFDGHSLLRKAPPDLPRYFACWYDGLCVGHVLGDKKVLLLPAARSWLSFDLAADPEESRPHLEAEEDWPVAQALGRWLAGRRHDAGSARRVDRTIYRWDCPANARCRLTR